jgi:thymidylate kinase
LTTSHQRSVPCIEVTGIDGSGKTSVSGMLARHLGWREAKVRPFDPTVLDRDAALRRAFGREVSDSYRGSALAVALLAEAVALDRPTVFDRYVESARMWWSVKNVPGLRESALSALPQPELVVHLDVPVDVGLARRLGTSEYGNAEERRFLEGCATYLRQRAVKQPSWITIDATHSLPVVISQVHEHLQRCAYPHTSR